MKVALDARKINDFGIGTYILSLVTAASRIRPDWQFSLIGPSAVPALADRTNVDCLPCRGRGYSPADIVALSAAARRAPADVFHCPHYVTPIGLDVPMVVTIHDCIHLRFPEYLPRPLGVLPRSWSARYARTLLRRTPRVAERLIAVSEATRGDVIDLLAADEVPIDVIHNGAASFWHQGAAANATRSRSIAWVGNPMPHKGLDVLLDAFTRLAADDPDLELTLAGSDDIASRCAGHEYGDRIRTPGFVSDEELREIYRAATVFCMPSRYEGFGLPALEAMAAGVPVVVSDAGALPEVTGGAALLVAAGDVAGLATALGNILADPDLASRLSAAGRQRARGLTWELCAERTCSSYVAAVGGTR